MTKFKLMKYVGAGQWNTGKVEYRNPVAAQNAAQEYKRRKGLRCLVIKCKS